jgi:hypothetical protein
VWCVGMMGGGGCRRDAVSVVFEVSASASDGNLEARWRGLALIQ